MGGADAVKQRIVACGAVPVPVSLLGMVHQEVKEVWPVAPQDQEMDWVTVGDRMHGHHHQDWAGFMTKSGLESSSFNKEGLGEQNHLRDPIPNQNWFWKREMIVQRKPEKKYTGYPSQKALACPKDGLQKKKQKHHGGSAWKSKKGKTQKPTFEKKKKKKAGTHK